MAALLGELVLVLANVAARVFFASSFLWMDEIARLALSILAFIGGAVAYRRRDHAFVRVVLSRLPPNGERACLALAEVVVLFVAIITGYEQDDDFSQRQTCAFAVPWKAAQNHADEGMITASVSDGATDERQD